LPPVATPLASDSARLNQLNKEKPPAVSRRGFFRLGS
jgi:hypothetical protein